MSNTSKIFFGLCTVLLLGAAGWFATGYLLSPDTSTAQEGESARSAIPVGITTPETRQIDEAVTAVGTLLPSRSVDLLPYAAGQVTEVAATSGQDVEQGDLLLQLDDSEPRATLAQAEATLSEARQEYRRIEELADRSVAAEARFEQARAAFARAEGNVLAAQADLEDHRITAPFSGTVGVIDIEPGAFLDRSTAITTLVDLSSVELAAELPERYFNRVTPGQTVSVRVPAYPDRSFDGEVFVRAPEIDPASRNFAFRARLDNPERLLAGGMFADARLIFGSYQGLAVADDAIISEGLINYVFVVENGTATRSEIEIGASLGSLTEVRSGLDEEARVVVSGWDRLSDGAAVEIADDIAREGLE